METSVRELRYDQFPLKLFFRLLKKDDSVAHRILGEKKWTKFKEQWEKNHTTIDSENQLERQKNVSLAFVQSQKAALVLKWLSMTDKDPKPILEELGYKWYDDPEELVNSLKRTINKAVNKYEHESALLEKQKPNTEETQEEDFSIDEAIASLDMMGFTIDDHDALTIGRYEAMTKVAERRMSKQVKSA